MTETFLEHFIPVGEGLRLYCRDYLGDAARTPVLCLHGLTRNCRDFDLLAPYLAGRHHRRVIVPDLRGRGRSDHDPDWKNYRLDIYVRDMLALLDTLAIPRAIIIGTSLGGFVGMFVASEHRSRVAALVLNDIGPELEMQGMTRIATNAGTTKPVDSWAHAAADLQAANRSIYPDFSAADWQRFAHRVYREGDHGRLVRDVDPNVGRAVREPSAPVPDFWAAFASLHELPLLCLRGELSDLLSETTVERMRDKNPHMRFRRIPRCGHAPTLDEPESLAAIDDFLLGL